jgi:transposase-like protein
MSTQHADEGQHRYYRHDEAFWRDLISQQAQSGQTVRQFCKANGVATSTFHKWRTCLAALSVGTEADVVLTPEAAFVSVSPQPTLSVPLPPTVNPSSAIRASRDSVVLTLAGTRIELTGAHADRIVRHLLGRLGSSRC